jgi:hypothetical protein
LPAIYFCSVLCKQYKGAVQPKTGRDGTEKKYSYSSTLSLISALEEGGA